MPRLTLVLCALTLLGAAAFAGHSMSSAGARKQLAQHMAAAEQRSAQATAERDVGREENAALKSHAEALAAQLGAAEARLSAAEVRIADAERNYAQAKTVLSLYESTTRALSDEISALRQDLSVARDAQVSAETAEGYKTTIAELERELAHARQGAALPGIAGASTAVFASRPGRATVLTVGPESAFVVLNFGSERGAQVGQKLTVSQGTEVRATVLISDVRTNFSIAHVLPATLRGVLHKGDSALLLR